MLQSWIRVSQMCDFPIQNLPYGIFSVGQLAPRVGVAIGEYVLDLFGLHQEGLLDGLGFDTSVFGRPTLNDFMALESQHWRSTRQKLVDILKTEGGDDRVKNNEQLKEKLLFKQADVRMHLPVNVGDYTDFYSSREHATNVGIMFRGKENALQPNWLQLPVGYHGRSSSVVLSGTDVRRPCGQILRPGQQTPDFSECRALDFEVELAFFLGDSSKNGDNNNGVINPLGRRLTLAEAEKHIFGVVLMNDWSARDIQSYEYVPLGPFTAKNFCTSISAWVVPMEALQSFRCSSSEGPQQTNPTPLPYLQDPDYSSGFLDIKLQVGLRPRGHSRLFKISNTNSKHLYWNFKQQLVHHSVTGCPMRVGDLLGTGTISAGSNSDSDDNSNSNAGLGSMQELSWKGTRPVALKTPMAEPGETTTTTTTATATTAEEVAESRSFLQDGDEVVIAGHCEGAGFRLGFGSVRGTILPAEPFP